MISSYAPIFVALVLAVAIPGLFLVMSTRLGPRKPTREKLTPYESGILPTQLARNRVPIKFYLIAMLFLLFDVEVVFLYPWAVSRSELGVAADIGMGIFFLLLVLGLAYEWRKGAMEWE